MNTKEKPISGSNGVDKLLNALTNICGVYALDIEMIVDGTDGDEGENLKLIGKSKSEAYFKEINTLIDKIPKLKELSKDFTASLELLPPTTEKAISESDIPKIKNIQDFHKLKDEQA